MRIWVIGRAYPSKSNGMMGSFEQEQARMLAASGQEVAYISATLHPFKKQGKGGFNSWEEFGVKVYTCSKRFLPRLKHMYMGKARTKFWTDYLARVEKETGLPDVIHVHYPVMLLIADVLAMYSLQGVRIAVTEHWTKVQSKKLDAYELSQHKKYMEVADAYISVGSPLGKAALELASSEREIDIVPNVVSELFAPAEEEHEGYRFIAVGRLAAVKQFDKLIGAFAEAFAGNEAVKLSIVGDGKEFDKIEKLIADNGLESQVEMLGRKNRPETAKLVAASDCLVCCSRFETFGVPVIEAWASGIPVVSTDAAAVALDWFEEGLGVKYEAEAENGLADALKKVYEERDSFDRKAICEYAEKHFSEKAVAEQLIKIYTR